MLFASSNATQKAKQILREGLSKNAHDLIEILPSIPPDDLKSFKDYKLIAERSAELINRIKHIQESDTFIKQTSPEDKSLMQAAYNDIVQIHNIITK
ncbi:MAG: hypothetical protein IKK93_07365 [Campylobacter sp.]|nr:hypothetical protein [Campylobacter sp.]